MARLGAVLRTARERRVRPGWDDKVLADWNGLMIAALANAALVFSEPAWLDAATTAYEFVRTHMTIDGRLHHVARQGRIKHAAVLDDYANMSRAALALYEATGDAGYLEQAAAWVGCLDDHYWGAERGGYYYTADDAEALITRTRNASDNAVPSGNGTMLGVLARLWYLTGRSAYRRAPMPCSSRLPASWRKISFRSPPC